MQEIYNAEDRAHAEKAIEAFAKTYGAKWPKAVAKITDDRDELLAFYDFPAEHWIHLRTTNPIESTFSTVKLRTKVTRGAGSPAAALAMVFKLVESAQDRWRAITGAHLVALVRAGAAVRERRPGRARRGGGMTGTHPDLAFAHRLADAADTIALQRFGSADTAWRYKSDGSPVSIADEQIEHTLRNVIQRERPDDGVLGEEFGTSGRGRRRWVIDAIDGTASFLAGEREWSTLIALEEDGTVLLGLVTAPALRRRWWAARGTGAWTRATDSAASTTVQRVTITGASSLGDAAVGIWPPPALASIRSGHRRPPRRRRPSHQSGDGLDRRHTFIQPDPQALHGHGNVPRRSAGRHWTTRCVPPARGRPLGHRRARPHHRGGRRHLRRTRRHPLR